MNLLKYSLLPFSLLYGAATFVRNKLYDYGILPSYHFDLPVITVGNLSVGGTGKTPHVEYLLRLLSNDYNIATLSRGYGRKTKGFLLAGKNLTAADIGDEPTQYLQKFKTLLVAVDEDRVHGINTLLQLNQPPAVIVLDDAYQHRALKAGFSILLTDYAQLYCNDLLLPAGRLRESRAGAKRANCIIVTKTPASLTAQEKTSIVNTLKPLPQQRVYFSSLHYGPLVPLFNTGSTPVDLKNYTAIVLTGIAKPEPLLERLLPQLNKLIHVNYPDHHVFTATELVNITEQFKQIANPNKLIITTEKDAMRLLVPKLANVIKQLPIYYLPIEVVFQDNGIEDFDKEIKAYIHSVNRSRN